MAKSMTLTREEPPPKSQGQDSLKTSPGVRYRGRGANVLQIRPAWQVAFSGLAVMPVARRLESPSKQIPLHSQARDDIQVLGISEHTMETANVRELQVIQPLQEP
eukprot:CAMPEP_0115338756 /NCGR_PEP_ID=MMETSP0270-20121206/90244_1 /TAXON_ID=71861 /ORGANISM="Scrippsiella trochoidea, Strain CCMP3099" /LENGTH=104 /DNA_ID=CAMNT_0002760087 /DNA_START=614 /DNA_END=930 /DNA_ORIENTATION=-